MASVGFGTASLLGDSCYNATLLALDAGFRKFETASIFDHGALREHYDGKAVGRAFKDYFEEKNLNCATEDLKVTLKVPPFAFSSIQELAPHAAAWRKELLGFCQDLPRDKKTKASIPYPLDIYFLHVPDCDMCQETWGDARPLPMKSAWTVMEAVVGIEQTARRIGLSNVQPAELLDIIQFVKDRQKMGVKSPPPRLPDAVQHFADAGSPATELRSICMKYGIEFIVYDTGNDSTTKNNVVTWALEHDLSVVARGSTDGTYISELANMNSGASIA